MTFGDLVFAQAEELDLIGPWEMAGVWHPVAGGPHCVQDGAVWSSAGVSAGIDLTLASIASVAGEEAAAKVQFASEYDPSERRYGTLHHTHPQAPQVLKAPGPP